MANRNLRVADLTVGELLDIIDEHLSAAREPSRTIRGVGGLAEYLHCSVRSAQRLKSSGRIDKAIIQSGRTIVIDEARLRRELKER